MIKNNLKIMLITVISLLTIMAACKKEECDKTDPNSDCYVPPVNPNPTKHTTKYPLSFKNWDQNLAARVIASADSSDVERVILSSACDFYDISPTQMTNRIKYLEDNIFSKTNKVAGCDTINPGNLRALTEFQKTQLEKWGFVVIFEKSDRE